MIAYLDPASGSMILSVVAGGAAGAAVFARSVGNRMKFWKKGDAATVGVGDDTVPDAKVGTDAADAGT